MKSTFVCLSAIVAGIAAVLTAVPAYAACQIGPYVNQSTRNYTYEVSASQMALSPGSNLYSLSGNYRLTFQTDGNLVVYGSDGGVEWSPNVQNCVPTSYSSYQTIFQGDGNLVVYYAKGGDINQLSAVWSSHTYGHPSVKLKLQDDGNLIIHDGDKVYFSLF